MPSELHGVALLSHLGVLRAQGADAVSFLQGQLTNDFALLGPGEARLAAWCNAKGRMLASFVGWRRADDEVLLVCARDVLPATLKRLSMFVLRAKVKLTDASAEFALHGLLGAAVPGPAEAAPWTRAEVDGADFIRLHPAAGLPRALSVRPAGAPAPQGAALPLDTWLWSEVESGVATVTAAIAEAFVPQMLNYESVGGVNFRKGCYPGQEVVARSQFRGTIKRRAFVVRGDAPMAAAQEVFDAADASQPVGLVAEASPSPDGGWAAIASLQVASAQGDLRIGSAEGPRVQPVALPYRLLEDL